MKPATPFLLPEHLKLVGEIDEFKGRWSAVTTLSPEQLGELKRVAVIESVGSSTRIEGAKLSNAEVQALLSGLQLGKLKSRDEQEVAGYAAAADRIFRAHADLPLTEDLIKDLHRELLQFSHKDGAHAGRYKTRPNHIEAFDAAGKSLGVVFETVAPADTPAAMADLVRQFRAERAADASHPLLTIALFTLQFLYIHPFLDGNGRLSRLLTTLLLLQAGYAYVPYCALEKIVEDNKDRYYLALRQAQETLTTDNAHLHLWFTFFLNTLARQVAQLKAQIARDDLLQDLPPLSRDLLTLARSRGRLTVAEGVRGTAANRNTVKVHVANLEARGLLQQHGSGKGTWYQPTPGPAR